MRNRLVSPFDRTSADELVFLCRRSRIFVSMPYLEGLTPRPLGTGERAAIHPTAESVERREGIFELDGIGLSPFDHGILFGDGVFEDISFGFNQVFLLKEHLATLMDAARKVSIAIPYSEDQLARRVLRTVREAGFSGKSSGKIRIVVTRGLGGLDIHPHHCLAPTVCIIALPFEVAGGSALEKPIEIALSRKIRRQDKAVVDPNIRSCSCLNSILGVLESAIKGKRETMMVTTEGNVAEATSGHLFFAYRGEGWEANPARATLITPSPERCHAGIARDLVLIETRRLGFSVREADDMQAIDCAGPDRECFIVSADSRLTPVTMIEYSTVGDGNPGPVTQRISEVIARDKRNPEYGLNLSTDRSEVSAYFEQPTFYER